MSSLPHAREISHGDAPRSLTLSYDDRFLRRKKVVADDGASFVVDLPQATSLNAGDVLVLDTGDRVEIRPATEPLFHVTGDDLARLAWHIGNRHTPCQIEGDHLLIQRDKVIGHMLEHLGATLAEVDAPFTPEGGAYGHGRTMAHEHGHTAHAH